MHENGMMNQDSGSLFSVTTQATHLNLLLDRQTEWQARLAIIRAASQFLYTTTYYIEYDRYALEFLEALEAALQRGVAVTLVIDAFGQRLSSNLMNRQQIRRLNARLDAFRQRGGQVVYYRAPRLLQRLLGTGYHIKYHLSDEGTALLASSNISQMSFERWFEFALELRGPIVAALLEDLFRILPTAQTEHLDQLRRSQPVYAANPGESLRLLSDLPARDPGLLSPIRQRKYNPLSSQLADRIVNARRSILLTSFYYKPEPLLFQAVLEAARRGVHVEIHHSHRDALGGVTTLPWLAAACRYRPLLENGVLIYEHVRGQHTKFLLIDKQELWLGTYNFEYAAHDRLAEVMLQTTHSTLISEVHDFFAALRADPLSLRVTSKYLQRLPLAKRLQLRLSRPIYRWL